MNNFPKIFFFFLSGWFSKPHKRHPRKEALRPEGKRYLFYSFYTWGSSACVVTLALIVHFFIDNNVGKPTTSTHTFFTWYKIGNEITRRVDMSVLKFMTIWQYQQVGWPYPSSFLRPSSSCWLTSTSTSIHDRASVSKRLMEERSTAVKDCKSLHLETNSNPSGAINALLLN